MNQQELTRHLAAANPVHASDLGDSAATPEAIELLERLLTQPPAAPSRTSPSPRPLPAHEPAERRTGVRGTTWRRRLLAATLTLLFLAGMQAWPLPASQALASWTPIPERIKGSVMDDLGDKCLARLRDMANADNQLPVDGWSTVLVDQRGNNAIVLLQAPPQHYWVCTFIGGQGPSNTEMGGGIHAPRGDRALTINEITTTAALTPRRAIGRMTGQVGPDVARVVVTLDDGRQVQASVREGWYLAWWPEKLRRVLLWQLTTGTRWPQAVRAYDSAGHLVAEERVPASG